MPESRSTIIPALRYLNAPAAIEWLCMVFGFKQHAVYSAPDGTVVHAQLTLNGGMIMLASAKDDEFSKRFKAPAELGNMETASACIVTADVDAMYARALAAGATMIRELQDTDYGSREFAVLDPEGHSWWVGTYDPWAAQS